MAYVQPNQLIVNPGGAGSHQQYSRYSLPAPHPSTLYAPMPLHWFLADGRRAERVPRPQGITPSQESFPGVTFSTSNWPGVRVKDLLKQKVVVDSPTDTVFAHHGWRNTTLALEWPGYLPCSFSDASRYRFETLSGGRPTTRQEFAQQIAYLIADVYNRAKGKPVARGWEKWTFSENGVRPSDVIILSAHYYRNVWIPELYVIE
ncbi:uncharacterized protein EDB91DRAFT_1338357 [Suillus paluster]|uniref:uncharacterized protein n=1 Tax=Suillus paluster TaxID=48578 RepID=UPI001B86E21A|nr:uncharacterized protein EDB91DRAFT_1338357 [Suillus paluster]KAG1732449.1 hypothetical protein EDB91DRAFT_1338357 [Suillus paluster]